MKRHLLIVSLCLCICSIASAQFIHVPASDPTVGTCNVIPLGSSSTFAAGYTYMGRIPASFMDPANTYVRDVAFTPCGTGIWSAPDVTIAIGHVPNPLPCPFSFPGPGGSSTGSFLDLTVIQAGGPFSYSVAADTWSDMGFAAQGGTGFHWNGVDDVGFYITFQNANVAGFNGAFHRTSTEPSRTYASGFNAATSTTCDAASGLRMRLRVAPSRQVGDADRDYGINGRGFGQASYVRSDIASGGTMDNEYRTQDPASPVLWASAPGGIPGWVTTPTNSVDIGPLGLTFLLNGADPTNPLAAYSQTNSIGNFDVTLTVPSGTTGNTFLAMAHVASSSPDGFWVSQTHRATICASGPVAGPTADDGFVNYTFAAGSFSFYGTTQTDVWVNSNGNLTFGSGDSDFTESATEMLSDQPRIAPLWCDLSPNVGGLVTIQEAGGEVTVSYDEVPHFSTGGVQNACVTLNKATGAIRFGYGYNTALNGIVGSRNVIAGISPGGGLGLQDALDLNAPIASATAANNAVFQWLNDADGGWDLDNQSVLLWPDVTTTVYTVN